MPAFFSTKYPYFVRAKFRSASISPGCCRRPTFAGRGKSVGCADRLGVRFPLCPLYFFDLRRGRMSGTLEQIGRGRVCDATTTWFLQQKKRAFCSNVRFWAFSASKCAMRLLQQTGDGDAGCAYLRKGEKRAGHRPMMPHDGTPCHKCDAGGWCDV